MTSAAELLDAWALRTGRAPAREPALPADPKADVLYRVAPESLIIPGYDDRQEGDPDRNALPLDEPMVLSVMALGVLEPIIVRRTEAGYEVVAGRRRTRHAREANRRLAIDGEKPLSVMVVVKGSRLSPEMASVVDTTLNEHRYNDATSVKLRKAVKMLARGIDVRTVAIAYRVEPQRIELWSRAATACAEVQTALDAGKLSVDGAAALAKLPLEDQPAALAASSSAAPSTAHVIATAKAVRRRAPLPGRVPKRAVRWVLDGAENFSDDFVRGIRFVRGELTEDEVREILAKVGR